MFNSQDILGAFSEQDASKLSGASVGQLKEWDRKGLLTATFAQSDRGIAYGRIYSFRDLVALRVLAQLRLTHKISLQHLREVSQRLAHLGNDKWTKTTLYVLGKKVVFDDPRTDERVEVVGGQRVFDIPLKAAISDTRTAISEANRRTNNELGNIVTRRFLQNNRPVFEGTRLTKSSVLAYLKRGFSNKEIIAEFPELTDRDLEIVRAELDADAA